MVGTHTWARQILVQLNNPNCSKIKNPHVLSWKPWKIERKRSRDSDFAGVLANGEIRRREEIGKACFQFSCEFPARPSGQTGRLPLNPARPSGQTGRLPLNESTRWTGPRVPGGLPWKDAPSRRPGTTRNSRETAAPKIQSMKINKAIFLSTKKILNT